MLSNQSKHHAVHRANGDTCEDARNNDDGADDEEDDGSYLHVVGQVGTGPVKQGV